VGAGATARAEAVADVAAEASVEAAAGTSVDAPVDVTASEVSPFTSGSQSGRTGRELTWFGRLPPSSPVARWLRRLVSPWGRFALLVVLLGVGVAVVLAYRPERLLTRGWGPPGSGAMAVLVFALAYGLATVAFVPRPLLNAAAGALYGIQAGLPAAVGGTVLGAGLSFVLGRALGRDALRTLLRGRFALSLDRQLSRHGFRSTLALRLFPGVPFAAANYAAAVSTVRLTPFLTATAAGSTANTAAYVVAGARAASPTSPTFLLALGFLGVTAVAAAAYARRRARPAVSRPGSAGGRGRTRGPGR
jgi:uncharacterized membrane protein YdjX (TVP38/TMEM64 family)